VAEKKADYLFSLKKNRETLYEDVREYFKGPGFSLPAGKNRHIEFQSVPAHDEKHGRIEDRDYAVSGDAGRLAERHPYWKTVRSIGVADSGREEKGEVTEERRYFVPGLPAVCQSRPLALGNRKPVTLRA
jgi:hypothetical protein